MYEIIVTASPTASSAVDRPDRISITHDAMQDAQPTTTLDILRTVPGVDVSQLGGEGGRSFVHVRGADPNFTAVYLNGVQINDPTNSSGGGFDAGIVDPATIESIVVERGALSSIFGSDALAGAINIKSRHSATHAIGELGVRGDHRDGATVYGSYGTGATALGAMTMSFSHRRGVDAVALDKLHRSTGAVRYTRDGDLRVESSLYIANVRQSSFPEDSGGERLAALRNPERRDLDQTAFSTQLEYVALPTADFALAIQYFDQDNEIDSPGIVRGNLNGVPASQSTTDFKRTNVHALARGRLGDRITVTAATFYKREDGRERGALFVPFRLPTDFQALRETWAPALELALEAWPGLNVRAGLRADFPDGETHQLSHHVAADYTFAAHGLDLFLTWGESFKLPSFFALGHSLVGNPELRSEEAESLTLSIRKAFVAERLVTTVTYFHSDYVNLIDFDPLLFRLVNRDEVEIEGLELDAAFEPGPRLAAGANASFKSIEVIGSAIELRRRPEFSFSAFIRWRPLQRLATRAAVTWLGDYADSSVPTGPIKLDGYVRADVSARLDLSKLLTAHLRVNNLFGSDFEETVGFPNLGTTAELGLRLRF